MTSTEAGPPRINVNYAVIFRKLAIFAEIIGKSTFKSPPDRIMGVIKRKQLYFFQFTTVARQVFIEIAVCFQVVEKVKKRDLEYKERWGKCAESEAVDFKIVL
jgi:hypothetical protein